MTTYGLTASGFVKKTYDVLYDEQRAYIEDKLGKDIDTTLDTPLGQLLAINAEQRAMDWEMMEAVYYSQYPNTAIGISLDNAAQLTNHVREQATFSFTTLRITAAEGTSIPAGTKARTSTGIEVATISPGVIGVGETYIDLPAQSVEIGAVFSLAGTITELSSPISGVTAVTNTVDLEGGRDTETDEEFRARRLRELQQPGTPTIEGIRNALLNLSFVDKAIVIENDTMVTDSFGRPPKSFECYLTFNISGSITDPANDEKREEVAETIFLAKAAGIEAHGSITENVIDSQGFTYDIKFSEPTAIPVIVEITVEENTDLAEGALFPSNGEDLIKEAILSYGATLDLGQDVWLNRVAAAASSVSGVKGISALTLNGVASSLVVSPVEVATWDSSNITITVI